MIFYIQRRKADDYTLEAEFSGWVKFYDDDGLVYHLKADVIKIYRAGQMGTIVQYYDEPELANEDKFWLDARVHSIEVMQYDGMVTLRKMEQEVKQIEKADLWKLEQQASWYLNHLKYDWTLLSEEEARKTKRYINEFTQDVLNKIWVEHTRQAQEAKEA